MSKLDLNLSYVLVALEDQRSVSGAALKLGKSQPAVSAALAKLRTFFDDPLFLRAGNTMQPFRADAIRFVTSTPVKAIYPPAYCHESGNSLTLAALFFHGGARKDGLLGESCIVEKPGSQSRKRSDGSLTKVPAQAARAVLTRARGRDAAWP